MRKRIAATLYAMLASVSVAACATVEAIEYAEVCDDSKDANCAPDRKVIVDEKK